MLKNAKYTLLATFILFLFSCDNGVGPELPPSTKAIFGSWVQVREEWIESVDGDITEDSSDYVYASINDYVILHFTESGLTNYAYTESSYTISTEVSYFTELDDSSFIMDGNTFSYSISNDQLVITNRWENGADYEITTMYFDPYIGAFPPEEWTAIDPGYSSATQIISNNPSLSGTLTTGSRDWYQFDATVGSTYTIQTDGGVDDTDTVLELYSTDGSTYITENDDYTSTFSSQIIWECTSSGTYYFKVRGFDSYVTGPYTIAVTN